MATNRILLAKGPNGSNLDQLFDVKNDDTCGKKTLILNKTYDLSATVIHDNYYEKSVLNLKFANLEDCECLGVKDLILTGDLSGNDASFNHVIVKGDLDICGNLNATHLVITGSESLAFSGASTIKFADNHASALILRDDGESSYNDYLTFDTLDGNEGIIVHQKLYFNELI